MTRESRRQAEPVFKPRKSRGQNFLIDGRVADRQVAYADIGEDDVVLEVGPGYGVLTERLVEKASSLHAIEVEPELAEYNRQRFGERLDLIEGDALRIDWPRFDVFVSNLPYSISTPMIFRILEHDFRRAVVMVQKEFADRMVAEHGTLDYSRLSVGVYYRCFAEIVETVPPSRFRPRPKVDSAIVVLTPRPPPFPVKDPVLFQEVVDRTFQHRRKTIRSALRSHDLLPADEAGIPFLDERVEVLRPEEIGQLADSLHEALKD